MMQGTPDYYGAEDHEPECVTYDVRLYRVEEERDARIIEWRVRCFARAGFSELNANALAVRRDIDRADVERLLARGASHVQAMAIVL